MILYFSRTNVYTFRDGLNYNMNTTYTQFLIPQINEHFTTFTEFIYFI